MRAIQVVCFHNADLNYGPNIRMMAITEIRQASSEHISYGLISF